MDTLQQIEALHTAARRYCQERHAYWVGRYSALQAGRETRFPYTYSEQDRDTFPRYNVLDAIRVEVERFRPEDFESVAMALQLLCLVGESAESDFTRDPDDAIQAVAMQEERGLYVAYLRGLSAGQLEQVESLAYRRILTESEGEGLRARLFEEWGARDGWYPLTEASRSDVAAFQDSHFAEEAEPKVQRLLAAQGVSRIIELRECGPDAEIDLQLVSMAYDGSEGYWFDGSLEWIVYASHESSITVGGSLLPQLQAAWPSWRERVWTSPFFE